jgi:hypothetical protein
MSKKKKNQVDVSSIQPCEEHPGITAFHDKMVQEADAVPEEKVLKGINEYRKKYGRPPFKSLDEFTKKIPITPHTCEINSLKTSEINPSFEGENPTEHGVYIPGVFKNFQHLSNNISNDCVWHLGRGSTKDKISANKGYLRFRLKHNGGPEFLVHSDIISEKIIFLSIEYDDMIVEFKISDKITSDWIAEIFEKSFEDIIREMINACTRKRIKKKLEKFLAGYLVKYRDSISPEEMARWKKIGDDFDKELKAKAAALSDTEALKINNQIRKRCGLPPRSLEEFLGKPKT